MRIVAMFNLHSVLLIIHFCFCDVLGSPAARKAGLLGFAQVLDAADYTNACEEDLHIL